MSFIEAFVRALIFGAAGFVSVWIIGTVAETTQVMQLASISAETTQTLFIQQQETIRFLAQVNGETTRAALSAQTSQVWAREAGDAVRTVAALLAAAVVASVLGWQGFKTARHWLTERNRERAILLMFGRELLPDADPRSIRVERVEGRLMLRDYATRRQWGVPAAQAALAERGLLTVVTE